MDRRGWSDGQALRHGRLWLVGDTGGSALNWGIPRRVGVMALNFTLAYTSR